MFLRSCIVAASVVALAGCGKSDETKAGNEAAPSAPVATGSASAPSIQPGQWEVATEALKVDAPNMPKEAAGMLRSSLNKTTKICITAADLKQSGGNLFTGKKNENCSRQEFGFEGGRVRGQMSCGSGGQAPGQMELEVDGSYTATTYSTTTKMQMSGGGMAMNVESRSTGRRIGDCPAGSEG